MRKTYYPGILSLTELIDPEEPTPTEEQTRILGAAGMGKDLVVQAHPGSGKTATARMLGKALERTGYFMVFNRDARRDARYKMPGNIKVVTGHSLAYEQMVKDRPGYQRKLEWVHEHGKGDIPVPYLAKTLGLDSTGLPGISVAKLAMAVSLTVKEFLISDRKVLDGASIPAKAMPPSIRLADDRSLAQSFCELVITWSRHTWQRMTDESDPFPITHDGYVKLFHLKEVQVSSRLWLLDEYQDTTPVQDAIIQNQEGQKIYIGDPYQEIYGWRGAVNAMRRPLSAGVERLYLSESFRFNQTIANVANVLLAAQGEAMLMKGQDKPFVHLNFNRHHTILVRNNLSMLGVVAEYLLRRQSVYIPGGLQKEALVKAQSALALFQGRLDEVKVGGMRELGSWQGLKNLATHQTQINPEYRDLVQLVERYHVDLPSVFEWAQRGWASMAEDRGRVTIITAHRAKGREWAFLRLHDDLALTDEVIHKLKAGQKLTQPEQESVNLLYVAVTRAKKGIALPRAIKKNLGQLNAMQKQGSVATIASDNEAKNEAQVLKRTQDFIKQHGRGDRAR
jgi:hypothetical protein